MSQSEVSPIFRDKLDNFDWSRGPQNLTSQRFRPLYDRAFTKLLKEMDSGSESFKDPQALRVQFLAEFDRWLNGSRLNTVKGLQAFAHHDVILGVTHFLDDLHVVYGNRLVALEKEYAYHRRIRPQMLFRNLKSLAAGDVLIMSAPFPWFGDLHPETHEILERCQKLQIPVHIDGAWYGCTREFQFNFDHPAIHSAAFSLSKGLGLGSHRAGVRYSKHRTEGPVSVVNDYQMNILSALWIGLQFMNRFGSDYIQNRYGLAYDHICQKLDLIPTKAIHVAHQRSENGEVQPVGLRALLRYFVDDVDELQKTESGQNP